MSKIYQAESISKGLILLDDNINISLYDLEQFINDKSILKRLEKQIDDFTYFLVGELGIAFFGTTNNCFSLDFNPNTFENTFEISSDLYYLSILYKLDMKLESSEQINSFKEIDCKSLFRRASRRLNAQAELIKEDKMKEKYPTLYEYFIISSGKKDSPRRVRNIVKYLDFEEEYEHHKGDPILFNSFKKDCLNKGIGDIDLHLKTLALSSGSESLYFETIAKDLDIISTNIEKIDEWTKNNPIDIKFNKNDLKNVYLYLMYKYIVKLENSKPSDKVNNQIYFTNLEALLNKYISLFPYDSDSLTFVPAKFLSSYELPGIKKVDINIDKVKEFYDEFLSKNSYIKQNLNVPDYDKDHDLETNINKLNNYLQDILNETIKEEEEQGSVDATEEVKEKLKILVEEIKTTKTGKSRNEKIIRFKKIEMVLKKIQPLTVIGPDKDMKSIEDKSKVFYNYYKYFYPNGMVALDRIDGYGALYIMPVHIYREARNKKNLTEVKNIPGVISINHRNQRWLENAKNYIENGTEGLTEDDIVKTEEVASIDFPYTVEDLEKLEKEFLEADNQKGVEETEKRIKKTKILKEIDSDLKKNEFNKYEIYPAESRQKVEKFDGEKDELMYSDEIEKMASTDKSFGALYEYWRKHHQNEKYRRNPVVAAVTKRRSMDDDGLYCCELCTKEKNFDIGRFHSHHVIPLSKGGPDNIYNTVCLCPNCHELVHSHSMATSIQAKLFSIIEEHLKEETPEYLPEFYEMTSPIAKDEKDYEERKDEIDEFFAIDWNKNSHKSL